jgi:hypothetical protein
MNPLAATNRRSVWVFNLNEPSWCRSRRPVEHNVKIIHHFPLSFSQAATGQPRAGGRRPVPPHFGHANGNDGSPKSLLGSPPHVEQSPAASCAGVLCKIMAFLFLSNRSITCAPCPRRRLCVRFHRCRSTHGISNHHLTPDVSRTPPASHRPARGGGWSLRVLDTELQQ